MCQARGIVLCDAQIMKWCPKCHSMLEIEAFSWSIRQQRGGSYCRTCQSAYSKAHYRRNAHLHNRRRANNRKRYQVRNRTLIMEYMRTRSCVDCGERDTRVFEFDHVQGEKSAEISFMVQRGYGWRRIEKELAKCVIRCANCHRRKTLLEFGWWQSSYGA